MYTIKIKYFTDVEPIKVNPKGSWIDLRAAEDVPIKAGHSAMISLGVGMKLPEGYEAVIVPRSSTYKNFHIIQLNHMGVIDPSYCGDDDCWKFPAFALEDTIIHKNDRICQFRIQKIQPQIEFDVVEHLDSENRGGFGSTGTN